MSFPGPPRPLVVAEQRHSTLALVLAWTATVVTGGYFLPWAIAATRGKTNSTTIGWVNFLLGWTIVGWIVALVMACRPHHTATWY